MTEKCTGCAIERIEQMIRHTFWSAGAKGIVVGVSGGVDSAVSAALSARAVGGEHVFGLSLPSAVTPEEDIKDARLLCETFGIVFARRSIAPMVAAFATLEDYESDPFLEGNLAARMRMATLYYYANRREALVAGTSNRSEYMLGYCTKYGDNAADFQPILHLYKTEVWEMARELGVPESIIKKAPSAGLWKGQSDEKELGYTYEEIDRALISLESGGKEIFTETEKAILSRVRATQHKRMPAPGLLFSETIDAE